MAAQLQTSQSMHAHLHVGLGGVQPYLSHEPTHKLDVLAAGSTVQGSRAVLQVIGMNEQSRVVTTTNTPVRRRTAVE